MPISSRIKPNFYQDSVTLMKVGQTVLAEAGVRRATLLMGTPANKEMLAQAALFRGDLDPARPGDLMIIVEADTDTALERAHERISRLLQGDEKQASPSQLDETPLRSISAAVSRGVQAELAQISVPGAYAAAEAMKALKQGMHVFLFSNHVPIEQERELKTLARKRNLLVMGPDCGTAILRGVPLGFANVVRRGSIGLVGASGTGLQEVTCRIHQLGEGVTHAIGTGGRDVYSEIGGITMSQGVDLLAADADTRVIVIVSKPPAPEVARRILDRAANVKKPFVVLFLGAGLAEAGLPAHVVPVDTLSDAASAAVALAKTGHSAPGLHADEHRLVAAAEARRLATGQRFVRGMYSGGTFCSEAQLIWRGLGMRVKSNVPLAGVEALSDVANSESHCAVDFGSEEFTVGRPHPMIDMSTRIEALLQEARDPGVAVMILDVVLGYGSHDDPAGSLAPAISAAKATAVQEGRHLPVVAFVCGTDADPQSLAFQQEKLRTAGALIAGSSTSAARLGAAIAMEASPTTVGHMEMLHRRR